MAKRRTLVSFRFQPVRMDEIGDKYHLGCRIDEFCYRGVSCILALGFIGYLYLGPLGKKKLPAIGLPLIAAGAIANMYERVTAGAVVDYLDFYIKTHHWPAFNVADASISVGVALLLLDSFFDVASVDTAAVRMADKDFRDEPN